MGSDQLQRGYWVEVMEVGLLALLEGMVGVRLMVGIVGLGHWGLRVLVIQWVIQTSMVKVLIWSSMLEMLSL